MGRHRLVKRSYWKRILAVFRELWEWLNGR